MTDVVQQIDYNLSNIFYSSLYLKKLRVFLSNMGQKFHFLMISNIFHVSFNEFYLSFNLFSLNFDVFNLSFMHLILAL